jgi:hypothetical protein
MSNLPEITVIEKVCFEIQKIRKELDALEDFLWSEQQGSQSLKPRSAGVVDPRNGRLFREKNGSSKLE